MPVAGEVHKLIVERSVVLIGDALPDGVVDDIRFNMLVQIEVGYYLIDLVGGQYLVGDDSPVPSKLR